MARGAARQRAPLPILLETMNDGLIESDEAPTLTYANPRFAEMLGYTVDDLLGRPATLFMANGAHHECSGRVTERKAGHSEVYELSWLHREDHEVPTRISSRRTSVRMAVIPARRPTSRI